MQTGSNLTMKGGCSSSLDCGIHHHNSLSLSTCRTPDIISPSMMANGIMVLVISLSWARMGDNWGEVLLRHWHARVTVVNNGSAWTWPQYRLIYRAGCIRLWFFWTGRHSWDRKLRSHVIWPLVQLETFCLQRKYECLSSNQHVCYRMHGRW